MAKATAQLPDSLSGLVQAHDDPRYVEAWSKLQSIRVGIDRADARIDAEHRRVAEQRHSTHHIDKAHALVYGEDAPAHADVAEDLKKLEDERRVYRAAVEIAERRVREVEHQVSAEVIDRAWPLYQDLLRRQYAAAAALVEAAEAEREFARTLHDGGTKFGRLQRVLWPRATSEELERYRSEALYHFGLEL